MIQLPINPRDYVNISGDIPEELIDRNNRPSDNLPGMESHQVWVWMNGPGKPHWEIRGTGAMF
jgi:hypothetical protein